MSWASLSVLLVLAPAAPCAAAGREPVRVLVIHQYSLDMPFRITFDPALQKALQAASPGPVEIYSEALETAHFPGPEHAELMRRYLRKKYRGRSINVIVAAYDTALEFVRADRVTFLPGVPIVALTTRRVERRPGERLTGVWTGSSVVETVRLALRLHPSARHLYVVESAHRNIGAYREVAQPLPELEPHVSITDLRDRRLDDVQATLRAAPANSIVLYLRQLIGPNGERIDQSQGLSRVVQSSLLPVYGVTQSLVGSGLIGGYMGSVEWNAAQVAELVLRVASGVPAESIPPTGGVIVPYFDARELRRHGIDEGRLPAGSRILFKGPDVWSLYRGYAIGGGLIIFAQAVLIGALLLQRRRRLRAERALGRAEARNRATLRALPDLMLRFDREGRCLDLHAPDQIPVSPSPERLLGPPLADLVSRLQRELAQVRTTDEPRVVEHALTVNGRVHQFEARLVGCEGTGDLAMSLVRDVTDQRRATADLVQSRQRYELATSACGAGVWEWNLATGDFYIDAGFMRILGYDVDPPSRFEQLLEYVHAEDKAATENAAQACLSGVSTTYAQEHRLVCRDGAIRWFQYRGAVVANSGGAADRMVGTFWDVTERKEAESALLAGEQALRATDAEIRDLAGRLIAAQEAERARIARDLHDDMSQKLALLQIELNQLGRQASRGEDFASDIRKASVQAAEIANDVHRLSYQLHPTRLEALGLVPSIQGLCADLSHQHGVCVEFHHQFVPRDLDAEIAICLFRVVQESLRNVVRHSGARRARVRLGASNGELRLHIADTGRGFDVESMSRAGLGLLSMRERVKFVGGDILIRSVRGIGTRITVRVPCLTARIADKGSVDRSKTA